MFNAIKIDKTEDGQQVGVCTIDPAELPDGDVSIDVEYSTLNYKDGLAITGKGPVVRQFPMVPGIDLAGTVSESRSELFKPGDKVLLNGWGVGEVHWGGLSQKATLKSQWLLPLPEGFTSRDAMVIGTAGYTAALCVQALLDNGVLPDDGEILVTGASGGVGSFAITLLASLGFSVCATTGKLAEADYLKALGAKEVIDRNTLSEKGKPLQRERWAGAIDSVGSHTLANVCAQTRYGGTVAACGLAQGADLPVTVMPFILRGVTLSGIDSVMAPRDKRLAAWQLLAEHVDQAALQSIATEIGLDEVVSTAERLIAGEVKGRVIVNVNR